MSKERKKIITSRKKLLKERNEYLKVWKLYKAKNPEGYGHTQTECFNFGISQGALGVLNDILGIFGDCSREILTEDELNR